jgi:hypothetical protein
VATPPVLSPACLPVSAAVRTSRGRAVESVGAEPNPRLLATGFHPSAIVAKCFNAGGAKATR